jgi:predicted nucleic acid-binding protein
MSLGARPTLQVAESPAAYHRRPRLVVDTSVLIASLFSESEFEQANSLLRSRALVAPHLLDLEVASAAQKKLRRENLPVSTVDAILKAYVLLPIERHPVATDAAFELAARYRLTVYDAAYLYLAERLEAPLATFDAKLARAAQLHLSGDSTA